MITKERSASEIENKDVVSDEAPLDDRVAGAPFAVVALTYMTLLAVSALGIAAVIWLMS